MANEVLFRNATIGGFNKADVLAYIDRMNNKTHVAEKKLRLQIEDIKNYNKNLENDLASCKNEFDKLQEQIGVLKHKNDLLNDRRKTLEAAIFENKINIEMLSKEANLEKEKNRQLLIKIESLESKGRKYDSLTNQLGEIILDAHSKAEDIILDAKCHSEEITKSAGEMLDFISLAISDFSAEYENIRKSVYQNSQTIRENLECVEDTFVYELERFEELKQKIDEKHIEILEKINGDSVNYEDPEDEDIDVKAETESSDEVDDAETGQKLNEIILIDEQEDIDEENADEKCNEVVEVSMEKAN